MVDATKDLILNADDIALVKLSVPEWKDKNGNIIDVYIKQMSGNDAQEYIDSMSEQNGGDKNRNAKVLIASLCDSNGNKMFTKEDITALNQKNSKVLSWLVEKILEINFKTTEQIEDCAKNC